MSGNKSQWKNVHSAYRNRPIHFVIHDNESIIGKVLEKTSGKYNTMLAKYYRNSKVNVIVSMVEALNCRVRDSDSGILKHYFTFLN